MSSTNPMASITQEYWDEYNGFQLRSVTIAFLILSTVATILRFIARIYIKRTPLGWDDAFVVLGWISILGLCISSLLSLTFGVGYHIQRVIIEWPQLITPWGRNGLYAGPIIYCFAATFPKLSIIALYLRVFTDSLSRCVCWVTGTVLALACIINAFVIGFQCTVEEKAWNPALSEGHCHNIFLHFAYGSAVPNILTDVVMLILPIPVVVRLNVPRHVKISLASIFLLCGVGLVTSIIRFREYLVDQYTIDGTWLATPLFIWAIIEPCTYQISACLLACRPILIALGENQRLGTVYAWLRGRSSQKTTQPIPFEDRADTVKRAKKRDQWTLGSHSAPFRTDQAAISSEAFARGPAGSMDSTAGLRQPDQIYVTRSFAVNSTTDIV